MEHRPPGKPRFAEVVERVQSGEPERFSELVLSFQDMAVGYAYSILGDFPLAEDAAQEAFLDAYRHLGELREPLAFPRWLRRIVFKHCDRRTRRQEPKVVSIEEISDPRSPNPSPADVAERNEMRDRLVDALERLPEKQRAVLVLHYMSGHSLAELSAFLNVPAGTVKKRLHDGRENLREILTDEVADDLRRRRPSRDSSFAEGVVEILRAARNGDAERVRALLLRNPRLRHGRDVMGNTALILASNNGHHELAALLREAGAPVDHHEAAAIGDRDHVRSILDRNPELLDSFSSEGFTALGLAAHFGHLDTMRLLLNMGADVNVVSRHPIGATPLIAALFGRRVEAARLLIERGADVTIRRGGKAWPRAGWSPLHYASAYGFVELVSLLLERGASREALDDSGASPLDVAREAGQGEAARLLSKQGVRTMTSKEDFLAAVVGQDVSRVLALVDETPSLAAAKNENGVSAPLLALYHRKKETAEILAARKESLGPLDVFEAAAFGKRERLEAILEDEPELVDAYAQDGFFPLGLAAFFGREEAVKVLLARGANPNLAARNAFKVAAIHAASAAGSVPIVRALLDAGADVNRAQQAGFTPLHAAAMEGRLELAKLLLDRGADVNAKADDGRTALQMARDSGKQTLVELLS
jgi:RNA polymerase sigma factor (sigma-70 family)